MKSVESVSSPIVRKFLPMMVVILASAAFGQTQADPEFPGGYPTAETAQRDHDRQDYEHAVQAYQFFYPTISHEGIFQGIRDGGAEDNKGALIFGCGPKNVMFTANSDTPYLWG